jgi:hypothetical protein
MSDTATRVARGAAWLDTKYPGWFASIDLATLEISDCRMCVLGQVYTGHIPEVERGQLVAQAVASLAPASEVEQRGWEEAMPMWGGFSVFLEAYGLEDAGMAMGFAADYGDVTQIDNHYAALLDEWTRVIIERRLQAHPDLNDLTCSLVELRVPATVG